MTVLTAAAVLLTAAMSLIRDEPAYLFLGLALLAATAACGDLAGVPYNAMLRQLSTPETSGRISGFGSAAGYLGSVVLLMIVYFGFIMGDGPTRGLLGLSVDDGYNVRVVMLVTPRGSRCSRCRCCSPRTTSCRRTRRRTSPSVCSGAYRQVWSDISAEWQARPQPGLLPDRQRGLPRRTGRGVHVRRGARASASTASRRPTCCCSAWPSAWWPPSAPCSAGTSTTGSVPSRHRRVADRDGRRRPDAADAVGAGGVLGLRAGAVPVPRPDPGLGADAAAADVGRRARGHGVRSLHHDGPGGVIPGAVAVLRVRRRLRHRPRRMAASAWCWRRDCWRCWQCARRSAARPSQPAQ